MVTDRVAVTNKRCFGNSLKIPPKAGVDDNVHPKAGQINELPTLTTK
jgi:hypothetical protein